MKPLPFVKAFVDRHGKARHYFRRRGYPSVALPAPGTPGFLAAYERANTATAAVMPIGRIAFLPGSLGWVIEKFLTNDGVQNGRAPSTRRNDQRVFDELRKHNDGAVAACPFNRMLPEHVKELRNHFGAKFTSTFGDSVVNRLSVLWQFADAHLELKLTANPTVGVKRVHEVGSGHQPWTQEVFDAFEAHAPGHLRLAVLLLRYTGQRRGDAVKMKWSQYDGECITVPSQEKTGEFVVIPCHSALKNVLDRLPRHDGTILTGERGSAIGGKSLQVAISKVLKRCGLTGYTPHGLRYNAAQELADAGCNVQEIMAITGHRTTAMVMKYTDRAEKKNRARTAIKKWEAKGSAPKLKVVA